MHVPKKNKSYVISSLLILAAGFLLTVGISSLYTLISYIQGYISTFLTSWTGWDSILSSAFLGALFVFCATLLYLVARRGNSVAQQIEQSLKLNLTNEPTEFYATELIPTEELMFEFKKRGCKIEESDKGFVVDCKDHEIDERIHRVINPDNFTLTNVQRFAVIATLVTVWGVYIGALLMETIQGNFVWIIALAFLIFSAFILMTARIIRLWHTIFICTALNIFLSLLVLSDLTVIWSLWGALAIYIVLVAIAYLLKRNNCENSDKWYCDVM